MNIETSLFIVFSFVIVGFLIADLGFLNKQSHVISPKSALVQSIFWVGIAFAFAFLIFLYIGRDAAAEFISAYATEKMLSVDNLFVILLIFSFFKLEEKYHHRVLFWGILGAIIFRGIFITAGAFIISQFHWILYVFGLILIYTGIKLFLQKKEEHIDFKHNRVLRLARKVLPFTLNHHSGKFFVRENGKIHFTLLFMIILLVESTDIVFAVDSIPAAFAISQDPFIVFTSNIFAVMGLRALFFLIESILHKFHHLQKGLSFILVFIGIKMLLDIVDIHITSLTSFGVILFALCGALLLSIVFPKKV